MVDLNLTMLSSKIWQQFPQVEQFPGFDSGSETISKYFLTSKDLLGL